MRALAPPPLLFAAGLVAGVLLDRSFPLVEGAPRLALRVFGGVVPMVVAAWLWIGAISEMRRARTTFDAYGRATALVTTGPFRLSRNPIYVGMTLAYLGASVMLWSAWAPIVLPLVLVALYFGVVRREERHLEARFGAAYEDYRRRVRRWL